MGSTSRRSLLQLWTPGEHLCSGNACQCLENQNERWTDRLGMAFYKVWELKQGGVWLFLVDLRRGLAHRLSGSASDGWMGRGVEATSIETSSRWLWNAIPARPTCSGGEGWTNWQ